MNIRAGCCIAVECPNPTPMLLKLSVGAARRGHLFTPDEVHASGAVQTD